jgi:hypothetical protein
MYVDNDTCITHLTRRVFFSQELKETPSVLAQAEQAVQKATPLHELKEAPSVLAQAEQAIQKATPLPVSVLSTARASYLRMTIKISYVEVISCMSTVDSIFYMQEVKEASSVVAQAAQEIQKAAPSIEAPSIVAEAVKDKADANKVSILFDPSITAMMEKRTAGIE